jgi:crotonobetainyl-CoA:carnitine CoA-transferase CaiB-like acyl-CoA transferase
MSALRGIRVIEVSESVSGEYCGKLLADFGADVIKVEKPGIGSPTRRCGPFVSHGADNERSGLFAYLNTNKRSVALDVSVSAGSEALIELLAHVDVVIDDHVAGWLKNIGLDPATLDQRWPQLVLCSITAFGQSPPEDRLYAEDLNVFQASGLGYHTPSGLSDDSPPLKGAGRFLASYEAGLDAALCITASLFERETSKCGRFIDISKQEVLASRLDYVIGQMVAGDMDVSTKRTAFDLFGPAGIFPCRDGFAYIWMSAPAHWDSLRKLLGNPAWMDSFPERWLERECTPERVALCRKRIAEWLSMQEKEKVAEEAQKLGLILVAVNNAADLMASPQYSFRNFFAKVRHPVLGPAFYPTVPYQMSATPATIIAPAPLLGQHTSLIGALL